MTTSEIFELYRFTRKMLIMIDVSVVIAIIINIYEGHWINISGMVTSICLANFNFFWLTRKIRKEIRMSNELLTKEMSFERRLEILNKLAQYTVKTAGNNEDVYYIPVRITEETEQLLDELGVNRDRLAEMEGYPFADNTMDIIHVVCKVFDQAERVWEFTGEKFEVVL